jgi:CheY-like chemotaxis protein
MRSGLYIPPSTASAKARKRILVVEDNEVVLEILNDFLSVGYVVDPAPNASIALKRIYVNAPDMVLLDVNMPGTDGLTLLESIRKLGLDIPVFIITGYDEPGMEAKAKASGATAYLVKPVDLRRLDSLIADALHVRPLLTD